MNVKYELWYFLCYFRTLTARVQILSEKVMPDPLDGAVPASSRRLSVADHSSSQDDEASVKTDKVDFVMDFLF